MLKKICFSPKNVIETHDKQEVLVNNDLVARMTKLANNLRAISPKSDDFLYFSIIFLKSAEAALLDEKGLPKKVANGETAWGFFDEEWKWHGNTQPHRNNNRDIFPESELKKAAASWVGLPLCKDHESSSVDGIRGIILDTHYDEKYKQIIGLCALDKVNYPDLARKVETGLVRYGSMGTAVETSVCSECLNKATTQEEYCAHILNKTAHGEINVGLKPIEYSLVVQPAEPGAVLLKCIASLTDYRDEFINYGVDNVESMLGKLSLPQAKHLEKIMKTACGENGCSIGQRQDIVSSFLDNNGLLKTSTDDFTDMSQKDRNTAETINAVSQAANVVTDPGVPQNIKSVISNLISRLDQSKTSTQRVTGYEDQEGTSLPGDVKDYSGNTRMNMFGSGGDEFPGPDFSEKDLLNQTPPMGGGEPLVGFASEEGKLAAKTASDNNYVDDKSINSLVEDIMNESRLRKRAELRRRIAYYQGGDNVSDKNWREPSGFKSENYTNTRDKQDKQMLGTYEFNQQESQDLAAKEKLSRAQLQDRRMRRVAYMQGGAEGVEPSVFKSEDYKKYRDNMDKQMLQGKSMGGPSGSFPGDEGVKEGLKRASYDRGGFTKSAYNGPSLSTRFSVRRNPNGSVDHYGSTFEVFAGNKRVLAATAGEIYGTELPANWAWLNSQTYGQEVCKQIRASGLPSVARLLKSAQAGPPPGPPMDGPPPGADMGGPPPGADMGGPPPGPPGPPMDDMGPPMDDMGPPMDGPPGEDEEAEETPSEAIEGRLTEMEQLLSEVRDLVGQLEDESLADVDVNVFTGKDKNEPGAEAGGAEGEMLALSSQVSNELKKVFAQLDESADELSMVAETYDNISKLSRGQRSRFVKLASDAVKDADSVIGETKALVRVANSSGLKKFAQSRAARRSGRPSQRRVATKAAPSQTGQVNTLVSEAMTLRRNRRGAILKQAEGRILSQRAAKRSALLRNANQKAATRTAVRQQRVASPAPTRPNVAPNVVKNAAQTSEVQKALSNKLNAKRADEERESYRIKLRRAYDVGLEMQNKGLLVQTKTALDKQVDEIMSFDDRAFEAFKRSIGNARPVRNMKVASDLGGINIGVESDANTQPSATNTVDVLTSMWE